MYPNVQQQALTDDLIKGWRAPTTLTQEVWEDLYNKITQYIIDYDKLVTPNGVVRNEDK